MSRGTALPRLTSLRLFAAAVVVVFHLDQWGVASLPASLSTLGFVGVSFFFVLSGFVLAWGTDPALPARRFYRHRFARVWPSHAVMVGVAALVPVVAVARSGESAVANLLLVQGWWRDPEVVFGMNGVAWSLSCEMFFYAMFPLTVWVLRRVPGVVQWALPLAALVVSGYVGLQDAALGEHLPVLRFSEFLLGVVAGLAMRAGWRPRVHPLVAAVVLVAGLAVCFRAPFPLPNVIMPVPFLLVLLSAAARDLDDKGGWLRSRALIFAGEASFALYLVHELVIINLAPHLWEIGPQWVIALIIAATACVLAVVLHLAVERPANKLLRGRSRSVALAPPQALTSDEAPDAEGPREPAGDRV
ncbi:acyltransferase family protein [Geodermatophilus sp. CPCC 206100]|uniref:acyltransferase family protein n=1 Tax=Geodermatophilus sp. CPCC 206100 TaxID=3020054 RepID=UPI003B005381